jgi:hypothetical protein
MTTSQPPVPTSLRCLAVLPAIIMLGGYALLGPKPAESNATSAGATTAMAVSGHETLIASLPPIGEALSASENADGSALR